MKKQIFRWCTALCLIMGLLLPATLATGTGEGTEPLKVLAIGSSFGVDGITQLYSAYRAENPDKDIVMGNLYAGGCTLYQHARNIRLGNPYYFYYKIDSRTDTENSGQWETVKEQVLSEDKTQLLDGAKMDLGLLDEDWDIIVIQQSAKQAGDESSYQGKILTSDAQDSDYVQVLIDYVKEKRPDAKLYWHMTWAFPEDNTTSEFLNIYNGDQMTMYNMIVDTLVSKVDPFVASGDLLGIIPSGTAIQNIRTSYLGHSIHRDTLHLNALGRAVTGYTYYSYLFNGGAMPATISMDVAPGDTRKDSKIPNAYTLTGEDKLVISEAVNNALTTPRAVTACSEQYQPLKVLAIGDSYATDSLAYLYDIAEAQGKHVMLGCLMNSTASIANHYTYTQEVNGVLPAKYTYSYNYNGTWKSLTGKNILDGITAQDWDIITLQQSSSFSGNSAYYNVNIDRLAAYVNANKTNDTAKLAWNMTWAYQSTYTEGTVFSDQFNRDQTYMFESIADGVNNYIEPKVGTTFAYVIPTGTAIQNARTSTIGDDLNRDGTNLNTLGRTIAAYTYYAKLFGVDKLDAIHCTDLPQSYDERTEAKTLTETEQKAVLYATNNALAAPYQISPTAQNDVCDGTHSGWTVLTQAMADAGTLLNGKYYLTDDITLSTGYLQLGGTLCLNGHSITGAGSNATYKGVRVGNRTWNLCDCQGGGQISITPATRAGHAISSVGGTINMYGGTITGCNTNFVIHLGNVGTTGATFNMYGGAITNNAGASYAPVYISTAESSANLFDGAVIRGNTTTLGGAVYNKGTFTMNGGHITGNTAGTGGGVYNMGSFTMTGGTIAGNQASSNAGGGIYNNAGTVTISGGTIGGTAITTVEELGTRTGNYAYSTGGGIHNVAGGTLTLSGTAVLCGNYNAAKATGNYGGGGVYNEGTFQLEGNALIKENRTAQRGGGVLVLNGGTLNMSGGTISNNTADAQGGGVQVGWHKKGTAGTFTMTGGTIKDNVATAQTFSAAVNVWMGSFTLDGGTITGRIYGQGNTSFHDADNTVSLSFKSGSVDGQFARSAAVVPSLVISGGKFSATPTNYLATDDAYRVDRITEGNLTYSVVKGLTTSGAYIEFGSSLNVSLPLAGDNGVEINKDDYTVTLNTTKYTPVVESLALTDGAAPVGVVTIQGIAAKEMHDAITVTVTKGGVTYYTDTLSIYELAKAWHGEESATALKKTMLADMIAYGNEAYKQFIGGETVLPALDGASDSVAEWTKTAGVGVTPGYEDVVAATLSLKDQIELNIYVNDANTEVTSATFTAEDGTTKNLAAAHDYALDLVQTKEDAEGNSDTLTRIRFYNIPVKDVKGKVSITFTLNGDAEHPVTVTYSIKDYVIDALNGGQAALLQALQKYVDSVSAYLNG